MEKGYIYYNRITRKVMSPDEVAEEWKLAQKENRVPVVTVTMPEHHVIEDGYIQSAYTDNKEQMQQDMGKQNNGPVTPIQDDSKAQDIANQRNAIINEMLAGIQDENAKTYATEVMPNAEFVDITDKVLDNSAKAVDILDPDYTVRMLEQFRNKKNNFPDYADLAKASIGQDSPDFVRTGQRKKLKYDFLVKGLITLSAVALIYSGARIIGNFANKVSYNNAYNSAVSQLSEKHDSLSFVNKNKITIEGAFDDRGYPLYWIDTQSVARDILKMPDEHYIASLYLAYKEMGSDRVNGEYRNWDATIRDISNQVDETHPIANLTTRGCNNFEEFLIKAGFVDSETKNTSSILFETEGKEEVIKFAQTLENENPTVGGRI